MPKVHKQVAAKDYPSHGISKGDTYFRWSFRYGGKRMSKTYPKPSQLTNNNFLSQLYSIQEQAAEFDAASLISDFRDWKQSIEDLRDEVESSRDNLPEHFQESGPAGEILTQRLDGLNEWLDELESIEGKIDEFENEHAEAFDAGDPDSSDPDDLDAHVPGDDGETPSQKYEAAVEAADEIFSEFQDVTAYEE